MGKITKIELSESERIKLNFGFKEGSSHCFRMSFLSQKVFHPKQSAR